MNTNAQSKVRMSGGRRQVLQRSDFKWEEKAKPGKQEGWGKTPNFNAEFLDYHIKSFKL